MVDQPPDSPEAANSQCLPPTMKKALPPKDSDFLSLKVTVKVMVETD